VIGRNSQKITEGNPNGDTLVVTKQDRFVRNT